MFDVHDNVPIGTVVVVVTDTFNIASLNGALVGSIKLYDVLFDAAAIVNPFKFNTLVATVSVLIFAEYNPLLGVHVSNVVELITPFELNKIFEEIPGAVVNNKSTYALFTADEVNGLFTNPDRYPLLNVAIPSVITFAVKFFIVIVLVLVNVIEPFTSVDSNV